MKGIIKLISRYWGIVILVIISCLSIIFNETEKRFINDKYGYQNYLYDVIKTESINIDSVNSGLLIDKITTHNSNILNYLYSQKKSATNFINNRFDDISQSNNIYILIITTIFSFFLFNLNKKKEKKYSLIYRYLPIIILLLYFIEINSQDQILKSNIRLNVIDNGIKKINESINFSDTNIDFYKVNFENDYLKCVNDRKVRWPRKILKSLSPDIKQIIYYFVPLILILLIKRKYYQ